MARCKIAIATNSLGKSAAGHNIIRKLQAAKAHGFDGVEVAIECLEAHAASFVRETSRANRLRAAATDVFLNATTLSLEIIALNPFGAYDGLIDPLEIEARLEEAELWMQLCMLMRVSIFQIPSCIYPMPEAKITSDYNKIADNLRRLGRLAQKYGLVVAYEATAWGIHIDTWQQTRDIITLTGLPNVRYCLDTFHIAAKEAGDPFNAISPVRTDGLHRLRKSMDEMKRTVKASDIGYLQLSDASVADPEQKGYPIQDINQPPFMTQSRNCRMFPCEPPRYGGTLPALEVAKTIFEMGYTGWVSMEVFNTDLWDKRYSVPDEWASRGMTSWREIVSKCGLNCAHKL
ncbi:hypothetical protein B7463_g10262, partial [Scytalidium lignicola]